MHLSKEAKTFSPFSFLVFVNLHSFSIFFKKNMTLLADAFLNLRTPKHVVI